MMKLSLFLLVSTLLVASPALGGHAVLTSGDFFEYCKESIKVYEGTSTDRATASSCLSFVDGAIGMHEAFTASGQGDPFYCMPDHGVSSFDIISIWTAYLGRNPQRLNNSPIITLILAIREANPCSEIQKEE